MAIAALAAIGTAIKAGAAFGAKFLKAGLAIQAARMAASTLKDASEAVLNVKKAFTNENQNESKKNYMKTRLEKGQEVGN